MSKKEPVFIFVSGGVISGLGKGITTASLGLLLQSAGFKVSVMKVDMYLNQDAGTMNPVEHGEVFVTQDGLETDEDLGHYERFLDLSLGQKNYMTAGQIYRLVLEKERRLEYDGRCIDAYLEIPQEVIKKWEASAKGNDFFLIELGGTVGEYQNILFFEAARRLKIKYPNRVFFVHVVYLPIPLSLGEMKSKPAQQSILTLNTLGIFPDFIVCRAEKFVDNKRREKIALAAALPKERIFSAPDAKPTYEVPLIFEEQKVLQVILSATGIKKAKRDLKKWRAAVKKVKSLKKEIKVAIVGKYYASDQFSLADSYVSVVEAVKHSAWYLGLKPRIVWINSEKLEEGENPQKLFQDIKAIIVPGGFGSRGVEGKIAAIRYARENKIPFLFCRFKAKQKF
jgi:CTP synthase